MLTIRVGALNQEGIRINGLCPLATSFFHALLQYSINLNSKKSLANLLAFIRDLHLHAGTLSDHGEAQEHSQP